MKLKSTIPLATALMGAGVGYFAGTSRQSPPSPLAPALLSHVVLPASAGVAKTQAAKPAEDAELADKFTQLATSVSAEEALAEAAAAGPRRAFALGTLLVAWIKASGMDEHTKSRLLSEAEEAKNRMEPGAALISLAGILCVKELWIYGEPFMKAFRDNPLRSAMFPMIAGLKPDADPSKLAAICRDWLPWEQREFLRKSTHVWAQSQSQRALEWARQHPEESDGLLAEAVGSLVEEDPAYGERILATSTSPVERAAAAAVLGNNMAMEDTRKAVAWADNLPEGPEKEAAHEAIYKAVPRGVGAVLSNSVEDLPTIMGLVPGGPLDRAGFQKGDMLAGIEPSPGEWQGFAGVHFHNILSQLKGEPGTQVTIVAMRRDEITGQWKEFRTAVSREQLVLNSKPKN